MVKVTVNFWVYDLVSDDGLERFEYDEGTALRTVTDVLRGVDASLPANLDYSVKDANRQRSFNE